MFNPAKINETITTL